MREKPKHWGITKIDIEISCESVEGIQSDGEDDIHVFLKGVSVSDLRDLLRPSTIVQLDSKNQQYSRTP